MELKASECNYEKLFFSSERVASSTSLMKMNSWMYQVRYNIMNP